MKPNQSHPLSLQRPMALCCGLALLLLACSDDKQEKAATTSQQTSETNKETIEALEETIEELKDQSDNKIEELESTIASLKDELKSEKKEDQKDKTMAVMLRTIELLKDKIKSHEENINSLKEEQKKMATKEFVVQQFGTIEQQITKENKEVAAIRNELEEIVLELDKITGSNNNELGYDPLSLPSTVEFVLMHMELYRNHQKKDHRIDLNINEPIKVEDFKEIWVAYNMVLPKNVRVRLFKELSDKVGELEIKPFSHYPIFKKRQVNKGEKGKFIVEVYKQSDNRLMARRELEFHF